MAITSTTKIIGFDQTRPPLIQRQPCINLYLELDEPATQAWCLEFNSLVSKPKYSIRIDPKEGQFIETWVRTVGEVESACMQVKDLVVDCNKRYEKKMNVQVSTSEETVEISPEQEQLNAIVDGLDFS